LGGGAFADLDPATRDAVAETFLAFGGLAVAALGRVILQS
jgi:hypothetical protein